ncbi:DMT family transporter [Streptosporangium sp. NPDC004379]|uniref:DMT family transporter n=1 Tax=Streptosporangium sp. NPDC004379 TaxID=3366189 RepID=UPI00369C3614
MKADVTFTGRAARRGGSGGGAGDGAGGPAGGRTASRGGPVGRGRREMRGPVQAATGMFMVGTLAGVSEAIGGYPVYGGQALRYLVAAVLLFAVARASGLRFLRPRPREAALLVALALFGLAAFNVCLSEAARHGGPALAGTVLGMSPIVMALISGRPSPRTVGAATVVAAGAVLATGLGSGDLPALLWSLAALGCEVSFTLLAVPLLPRFGAVRVSAYSSALAVPLLAAAGWLADGTAMLRVPSAAEAAGLAYQAVLVTTVAFLLWYGALPRLGPGTAGLFAGMMPVGAIVAGTVLGLGAPTLPDLAGAALVVAGIAIGLGGPRRSPVTSPRDALTGPSPGPGGPYGGALSGAGGSSPAAGSPAAGGAASPAAAAAPWEAPASSPATEASARRLP